MVSREGRPSDGASDGTETRVPADGLDAELDSYFGKEGASEAKDDAKEDAKAVEDPLNP